MLSKGLWAAAAAAAAAMVAVGVIHVDACVKVVECH